MNPQPEVTPLPLQVDEEQFWPVAGLQPDGASTVYP
jgi:hypothetical protein